MAPTTCWITWRYSSLRCVAQNTSVTVVIAANYSAMAFGILSDMIPASRGMRDTFSHISVPKPSYRRRRYCWGTTRRAGMRAGMPLADQELCEIIVMWLNCFSTISHGIPQKPGKAFASMESPLIVPQQCFTILTRYQILTNPIASKKIDGSPWDSIIRARSWSFAIPMTICLNPARRSV